MMYISPARCLRLIRISFTGSEVFEKMLFGPLKMDTDRPIEIPDLTPVGFLNAIK